MSIFVKWPYFLKQESKAVNTERSNLLNKINLLATLKGLGFLQATVLFKLTSNLKTFK